MEDIVTFIFILGFMLTLFFTVVSGTFGMMYNVSKSEKAVLEKLQETTVLVDENGAPTERVLYITDVNGLYFKLRNRGFRDVYHLRVLCWDRDDPFSHQMLLSERTSGRSSIRVVSPGDVLEYNAGELGLDASDAVLCVAVGKSFIRGFLLHD